MGVMGTFAAVLIGWSVVVLGGFAVGHAGECLAGSDEVGCWASACYDIFGDGELHGSAVAIRTKIYGHASVVAVDCLMSERLKKRGKKGNNNNEEGMRKGTEGKEM